tara:strand:- start:283 stop:642 length:360 start_codon:yes stop_codon:yes gene_type:complete
MIIHTGKTRAFVGGFDDIPEITTILDESTPADHLASVGAIRAYVTGGGGGGAHKLVAQNVAIQKDIPLAITHNFGTEWVHTQVFTANKELVHCEINLTDANTVKITSTVAFTANVVVIG